MRVSVVFVLHVPPSRGLVMRRIHQLARLLAQLYSYVSCFFASLGHELEWYFMIS